MTLEVTFLAFYVPIRR